MAQGEPNLEGAIKVLVDLLTANSFTMTRSPYTNNFRGLVDALLDLKEGFPTFAPLQVGFNATAFQDVTDGDALFMRTSDGQVGKASAADGTLENATVVGFANSTVSANSNVKVLVVGLKTLSSLNPGDLFFLSDSTAGAITTTPPSGAGKAVTRVGEASTATDLAIHIEPPSSFKIMADVKELQPYADNVEGLVSVLEDFRQTMPNPVVFKVVGYQAEAFENISQGDAVYSRASDGKVGKAIANGTVDQAIVAGFAETTKTTGQTVRVIVSGQVAAGTQTLDAGDLFFLSASSAGSITKIPPTTAGQFLTFVGEAANTSELIIRIKRPIQLR